MQLKEEVQIELEDFLYLSSLSFCGNCCCGVDLATQVGTISTVLAAPLSVHKPVFSVSGAPSHLESLEVDISG